VNGVNERYFLVQIFCSRGQPEADPRGKKVVRETFVVDGPHMDRRIDLEYETEWDGTRGRVRITDARLE
jgi:diphthamide synthase (EF-2-diphthine--ammonia ligase)